MVPCLALVVLLSGCSLSTTPEWDKSFGHSLDQIQALQTINPEAGRNPETGYGLDGSAALKAQENYVKSYGVQRNSNSGLSDSN